MDGKTISSSYNFMPITRNGTTYLPLRFTMEALGYVVSWDDDSQSIEAKRGETKVLFPFTGAPQVNEKEIQLKSSVFMEGGLSYISLEMIEKLGCTVQQSDGMIQITG